MYFRHLANVRNFSNKLYRRGSLKRLHINSEK